MCVVVVAASFFLKSDKKEWKSAWHWRDGVVKLISDFVNAIKGSNAIPSIYTDLFPPYYSDCIWWAKLATAISA